MAESLSYDLASLNPRDRYKLLISLVIPRPIALVTTIGPTGIVNAAPFSFFNVFSEEPPLVVLGLRSFHCCRAIKSRFRASPRRRPHLNAVTTRRWR